MSENWWDETKWPKGAFCPECNQPSNQYMTKDVCTWCGYEKGVSV